MIEPGNDERAVAARRRSPAMREPIAEPNTMKYSDVEITGDAMLCMMRAERARHLEHGRSRGSRGQFMRVSSRG